MTDNDTRTRGTAVREDTVVDVTALLTTNMGADLTAGAKVAAAEEKATFYSLVWVLAVVFSTLGIALPEFPELSSLGSPIQTEHILISHNYSINSLQYTCATPLPSRRQLRLTEACPPSRACLPLALRRMGLPVPPAL